MTPDHRHAVAPQVVEPSLVADLLRTLNSRYADKLLR